MGKQIYKQKAGRDEHIYSVHEPAVVCIAKGKAGKQYEYGNKVSLAVTQANGWIFEASHDWEASGDGGCGGEGFKGFGGL